MPRIVKWKLVGGTKTSQETKEQKRQAGLDYIEKLKEDENVLSVEETAEEFIITLE